MGISGEFIPMIAHAIREQLCQARLNFDEAIQAPPMRDRPMRMDSQPESWGPEVRLLTGDELEKVSKEKERSSRCVLPYSSSLFRRMRRNRQLDRPRYSAPVNLTSPAAFPRPDMLPRPNIPSPQHHNQYYTPQHSPGRTLDDPFGGYPNGSPVMASSRPGSPPKKIAYKNYQATDDDLRILENYVYKYAPLKGQGSPGKTSPKKTAEPIPVDTELLAHQIELMQSAPPVDEDMISELDPQSPKRERSSSPVKKHRGFGASAQMFNADGAIDVGGMSLEKLIVRIPKQVEVQLVFAIGSLHTHTS